MSDVLVPSYSGLLQERGSKGALHVRFQQRRLAHSIQLSRLAQDGIPLDQKMARPVSYSRSATPLPSASVPASSPHVHTTPQHVQTADGMDSSASQSPRGSRVRFVDDHAGGERRVTPLAPSVLPIDVRKLRRLSSYHTDATLVVRR